MFWYVTAKINLAHHCIVLVDVCADLCYVVKLLATQLALVLRAQLACRTKAVVAKGTPSLRIHSHHFASKYRTGTGRMRKKTRTRTRNSI
jgi:hypothetical protein